jgi:hypothetical protein
MNLTERLIRLAEQAGTVSREIVRLTYFRLFATSAALMVARLSIPAADLHWQHLSSSTGDLPPDLPHCKPGPLLAIWARTEPMVLC